MTFLSSWILRIVRYSSLVRLSCSAFPVETEKKFCSVLFKNNSSAGEPLEEFQVDLLWNVGISLLLWVLFLKYHLHLIFLLNSLKSLRKSASLIKDGVGEKPKPFSSTLISVCYKTFLLKLKTQSDTNKPVMRPSSEWSLLLSHRDSRVSKSDSSPWVRSLTIELRCILRGETRGETYAGIFDGPVSLLACFTILAYY